MLAFNSEKTIKAHRIMSCNGLIWIDESACMLGGGGALEWPKFTQRENAKVDLLDKTGAIATAPPVLHISS